MGFFAGIGATFRALGMLFAHPRLLPLAAIPAVVGLIVSLAGIWAADRWGPDLAVWMWPEPDGWFSHFFWSVFTWLVEVFSIVIALVITPWLVMLLGFPLCDPLMVKAYGILGGEPVKASFATEMRRMVGTTVGVVVVGLGGALAFFALGLIPGLALITVPFVTFVWTPMFLAFDATDPTLSRRQLDFKQKLSVLTGNFRGAVGLGLAGTLLVAVPFLNLVGLPVLALGGVIMVRDLELKGRLPEPHPEPHPEPAE